jgi:hypothetical protein
VLGLAEVMRTRSVTFAAPVRAASSYKGVNALRNRAIVA